MTLEEFRSSSDIAVLHGLGIKTTITNYDRLTHMSMEDLAAMKKICRVTAENLDECEKWRFPDGSPDCYSCALDWLKQEAEDV